MSAPALPMPSVAERTRTLVAEAVGTMMLMLVGPGSAILAGERIGVVGVSLAFGFVLMAMAYTIGHVSGCHINPAVTLSFWLMRKLDTTTALLYMAAQVIGAIVGGLLLYVISEGGDLDNTGVFASNGWGDTIGSPFGLGAVIIVEIVFTALLVFVVLSTTTDRFPVGFGGLAAGVTLGMIHLATIAVDNTSVNPARSIGAAIFGGGDHLAQLWAFILFPLIGGALGALIHMVVQGARQD